jgi:hypothetical protein
MSGGPATSATLVAVLLVPFLLLQIRTLCLSPDGQLLLSVDDVGRALLVARQRRVLLHHFSFKGPVAAAAFSPDGKYIAAAVGKLLQVWWQRVQQAVTQALLLQQRQTETASIPSQSVVLRASHGAAAACNQLWYGLCLCTLAAAAAA